MSIDDLYSAAKILAHHKPAAVIWSISLADHSTGKQAIQALANLQMLLGNLDQEGGGVNPLRSQNNIQGACDLGCSPDLLPGYGALIHEESRRRFELAWGASISAQSGLTASQMLASLSGSDIKAMYIVGEELINTSSQAGLVRQRLAELDFVVLQEMVASETTRYADILLPGVSFAEKSGTFTSTDRRIQMVRQAIQPAGKARQDWMIISDLAKRILELDDERISISPYSGWDYADTEQIMEEISALVAIYAGISHVNLAHNRRVQWPVKSADSHGAAILPVGTFSDGIVKWTPAEQLELIQVDR